jgi:DNA-binding GntR family transcriptional regulator
VAEATHVPPRHLAHEVYRQLREEILLGRLRPRDHLVEVDLAERLNVSRTPVRESLQRLAADGLIVSHRRRWVVYEHTLAEIADIYEVRMALEGYAARLACLRATPEQIEELTRCSATAELSGIDRSGIDLDLDRGNAWFVEANTAFHQLITTAANNPYFQRLADSNRFYTFNNQLAAGYNERDVQESIAQHAVIITAIRDHDPDAAERAAREHVQFSLRLIRERLR